MKVLITGADGQLGKEIVTAIQKGECELGTIPEEYKNCEVISANKQELDISNYEKVKLFFQKHTPNIVINCAAIATADICEEKVEDTFRVNSLGAKNLAVLSETFNAKLVHISTDYVFGNDGFYSPICELEKCNPVNTYGKSKLLAEEYIKIFCSKFFIVRTAWLYGKYGKNFVKTIRKLGSEREQLKVINDQIGSPTSANDLVFHILKLALTEYYGVFHCTNNGSCSWYEFACQIIESSKMKCRVYGCTTTEYGGKAPRPYYSVLDNMMLRNTIGDDMRDWQSALSSYIKLIIEEGENADN
ncbi:dTDP-4-dehydrorhamnose reductase [Cellulosilyticum sp. ST5]|uniref:dTDP-4-dehydrorhamnose reductase n=1 Tax=unclassified Cellulosilyticum TaxID=2643091 RepID=UPI000F8EBE35|nr:dTDP-4-dehydrorhamnose reductase [Cellulosilyticum sp. WCF-2]QEH66977.1 dTDP-4-dehydrorhamnose reductase [Cellulosilyticum sp. WCF-2]